ncbi:MAG: hypothetical protein JWM36_2723 [Hyphomicrobiales bacterium]|nr:hypothetical protein [Hyphomicrobiales bacterium]
MDWKICVSGDALRQGTVLRARPCAYVRGRSPSDFRFGEQIVLSFLPEGIALGGVLAGSPGKATVRIDEDQIWEIFRVFERPDLQNGWETWAVGRPVFRA